MGIGVPFDRGSASNSGFKPSGCDSRANRGVADPITSADLSEQRYSYSPNHPLAAEVLATGTARELTAWV
jgi:hypothetical protein